VYVFGYGSLTAPESLSAELGRLIGERELISRSACGLVAGLECGFGFRLPPGACDQESRRERVRRRSGSTRTGPGSDGKRCSGAVFEVRSEDLVKLDRRERNYGKDRCDLER